MRVYTGFAVSLVLVAARAFAGTSTALTLPARHVRLAHACGPVNAIAESPDGDLWFGTHDGLLRHDGLGFERWDGRHTAPLPDPRVRRLLAARDGSLFAALGGGELNLWPTEPGRFEVTWRQGAPGLVHIVGDEVRTIGRETGLPSPWVWALAEGDAGTVFVGTEAGLCAFSAGRCTPVDGLPGEHVTALAFARGALVIGTNRGLVVRRDGRVGPVLDPAPVFHLVADAQGRIAVRTRQSLLIVEGDAIVARGPSDWYASLSPAANGGFWVGGGAGAKRVEVESGALVARESVAAPTTMALHEDREGSLWLGSREAGVSQAPLAWLWNVGEADGLGGNAVFAIVPGDDGSFWATTTFGLAHVARGTVTTYAAGKDVPAWGFRHLARAPDGRLWFVSDTHGLVAFDGKRFVVTGIKDPQPGRLLGAIGVDPEGDLWVADSAGVSRYRAGDTRRAPTRFSPNEGACQGDMRAFEARAPGRVWFAGEGEGLTLVSDGRARCFRPKDGLPGTGAIAGLYEAPDGDLWLGVRPAGLGRLRAGTFVHVGQEAGLPDDIVSGIVGDGRGHLWLTTARQGIARVSVAEYGDVVAGRAERLWVDTVGARDGLLSQVMMTWFEPPLALDPAGRLWAPTQLGLAIVTPPEERPAPRTKLRIEGVSVDGRRRNPRDLGALGPGPTNLSVRLGAPTFLEPERLVIEHRLVGLESAWTKTRDRTAVWDRVPPGRYTFEARARDRRGAPVGPALAVPVTVAPPFHQTWLFRTGAAAVLVALVLAAMALRESRVRARYRALAAERLRIAHDLHDGLAQGFASLGLLLDALDMSVHDRPARTLVGRARAVLDHFQADARRFIWDLRSAGAQRLPLRQALDKAVEEAALSTRVELTVSGVLPDDDALAHELPLIVKEAVGNAVKHGRATTVKVDLRRHDEGLELVVADDGKGVPSSLPDAARAADAGHLGLFGMRERATRLGGTLTFGPRAGGGAEVKLVIPPDALAARKSA